MVTSGIYDLEENKQISSIILNYISRIWVKLHHVEPQTYGCRCSTVLLQGRHSSDPSQVPLGCKRGGFSRLSPQSGCHTHKRFFTCLSFCFCSTTSANSQRQLFLHLSLHSEMSWATEEASGLCYPHHLQSLIKRKGRGGEALRAKIWNKTNGSAVCFKICIASLLL